MDEGNFSKHEFVLNVYEKRISAVFRAMCIVAPFTCVVFSELDESSNDATTNILLTCLLAFLLPLLFCMFVSIVRDAECFKVVPEELTQACSDKAQQCYNNIFICLRFSGSTSLASLIFLLVIIKWFPSLGAFFEVPSAIIAILWVYLGIFYQKHNWISRAHCIFSSLVMVCVFLSVCFAQ